MYSVSVLDSFSSAHFLRGYKGKCENLHGHNWKVSLSIQSKRLDKRGMVLDFKDLKVMLNEITSDLDHCCLNDHTFFKKVNPTSENIAAYIYKCVKNKIKEKNISGIEVSVWETDTSCATYKGK